MRLTVPSLLAAFLIAAITAGTSAETTEYSGLTQEELAAQAPDTTRPVDAAEVKDVVLEGIVEFGYQDLKGRYFVDTLERSQVYLGVRITTPDGRPVKGAMPRHLGGRHEQTAPQ